MFDLIFIEKLVLRPPELTVYDNFNQQHERSCKYKSKEIRNTIFGEYYYFCCLQHFYAFIKKNSCTIPALQGYMLNIYNRISFNVFA